MKQKEATARIKINKLLESAGWRFFDEPGKPANIQLERGVALSTNAIDELGEDFEKPSKGYVDFLLLDSRKFPIIVLEAKAESKNPFDGKEQARKYARSQNCRFIILSNGNLHYFWDLNRGNPYIITSFPNPDSIADLQKITPNPKGLFDEEIKNDYIVLSQRPNYLSEAAWKNEAERSDFVRTNKLKFLRPFQLNALHALQRAVKEGKDRFLFEMATGTGKTLTSAGVIRLFLKTGNARRVLFLVDRLELEDQAKKALKEYLKNDYQIEIYKEKRDEWSRAEVVITTVQSLLFNNKYRLLFSPTDFDLVISDEAHRSIGGNARAVFEYFIGYKLGLTATPKDYLKKFDPKNTYDPREIERRLLLDTYRTFDCEDSQPTFRYSLLNGVMDGYLINPTVVDARTQITTQLLSDKGFIIGITDENGEEQEKSFKQDHFEKKFFSDATNLLFCRTFLQHALRDPVSNEVGKSIIFCVSQNHAAKLTEILNQIADKMFPGKYQSDFAMQVTSRIADAQTMSKNFANNNLGGSQNFIESYRTGKTRVCVTVGMMTTGYDCPDILNLGLFRPIFSPTDFIQIKGRGTRKHNFLELLSDEELKDHIEKPDKTAFKLFDFFATVEYFEEKFKYDEVIPLPPTGGKEWEPGEPPPVIPSNGYEHKGPDALSDIKEEVIGAKGLKPDRMLFEQFEEKVKNNEVIAAAVDAGQWDKVIEYVNKEVFNKPEEYYSLDKLRKAASVDRRITVREIIEKIFGLIPRFKSKDELLEEEFGKFVSDFKPADSASLPAIKHYFKAYTVSGKVRDIIDSREYTDLTTTPEFSDRDFRAVPEQYRRLVPEYIKDYVSLNRFAA